MVALRGGKRTAERGADFQNSFVNHIAAVAGAPRGDFKFVFEDRGNLLALVFQIVLGREIYEQILQAGKFFRQFRAILRIDLRLFLFPDGRQLVHERLRLLGELRGFAIFERDEQLAISDAVGVFARHEFHATGKQPLHPADVRRRQQIRQTGFHFIAPRGDGSRFLLFIGGIVPRHGRGGRGQMIGQPGNFHQRRRKIRERQNFIFVCFDDIFIRGLDGDLLL